MKSIFLAFLLTCHCCANFAVKSYQEIKNARTIRGKATRLLVVLWLQS
ncbi:hypothetical protein [Campylobacter sp.]|nr:hypothetical protein [Campylobacter sp.]